MIDMRKMKLIMAMSLCLLAQWAMAQAPKWVEKAKQAVFSIVTYDKNDQILNTGNGFFVTEDGVALSDYTLFKGAQRAVAINSEGRQMPVVNIMGADDMYDVVKFRVGVEKKVTALPIATRQPAAGALVYLLPYSTQKGRTCTTGHLKSADKVEGNYLYYTLELPLKDKMISCPLTDAEGAVFGLAQKSSGQDTATICYAVDARYVMDQKISALSYNDETLRGIGIKKALPDTEEQALVFLYMASSQLSPEKYMEVLNDYIEQYPNSADGYMRRATQLLATSQDGASMKQAADDMDQALKVARQEEIVRFDRAKLIYNYMLTNPEKPYGDWSFDKALEEVRKAIALQALPVYVQLEGDILFAKQDYAGALAAYEQVNHSDLASPASYFSAAQTKEMMKAPATEILALMDSCVAHCPQPYTEAAGPYLLARAQALLNANQARKAMLDYDAYFKAMNGNVNAAFYYYREQAAMQARQYQRALDDLAKAIELAPNELLYRAELAVVNIRVGRSEEAVRILQEALKIEPNYAEAYRLMGQAYIQLKKKDEACECFAKAKELGDPNVDALIEKHCK
ncbi:MAG TPA: tetratricopeptide repeat protein [Candidatus Bacteroides merdigallinarum]|uniref:Tetratricopeptide repeat protein n=1 Tax=Candidatus Bacteroides merdigallinarum TaxID=2838473 RepID=A0A9D2E7R7_9BACE|nr:tetratricopeptide repeat protein [Candidatus Bacteroides merdigallinarum]